MRRHASCRTVGEGNGMRSAQMIERARAAVQPPVDAQKPTGDQKIKVSPLYSTSKPSSISLARKYLSSGALLMYRAQP